MGKAKQRRKLIVYGIVLWVLVFGPVTFLFRNSIAWVQVQSYLAILISLGAWYSAETPVEKEDDT